MQIILTEDIDNLGRSGEVVNVKPGYGRNFLIPRGMAVLATPKNLSRIEHEKRVIDARNVKLNKDAMAVKSRLEQLSINIARAVGAGDKLYGSVGARDIAEAITAQGVTVDHRKVRLAEPIRALGMTEVDIKLARDVSAKLKVWVVKKEEGAA
ncbi:MAG TPA: 50S ribosomal protein L9 [Polyangia bacterium]|jgi:large subunit ribosomal protein L9